ncbi:DUF4244 domain-containing protein [Schaalia suimastitidis]|uniref:DUF4244 domain-containing protein n=1 Tax=Schaalia suimastitidis TaxID=121163 RepID=UPI0004012331|nr:DUF4244 domain-containing protein [Schaalia suimastitidis]
MMNTLRNAMSVRNNLSRSVPDTIARRKADDAEEGSTTVEYAIGAVAAAAFAGLLLVILKSDGMRAALQNIIEQALSL